MKKRINICVDEKLLEMIDPICETSNASRSSFIEIACLFYTKLLIAKAQKEKHNEKK